MIRRIDTTVHHDMKPVFVTLLVFVGFNALLFAGNPTNSNESADDEVALTVERNKGEVVLELSVRDITQYDHIIIERSADNPNYFGKCRYITCAEEKTTDGKIVTVDKYPYPSIKDVYYRIKTVTKDGIARAYPAVLLAAQ